MNPDGSQMSRHVLFGHVRVALAFAVGLVMYEAR